jgi:hypothetical protein
MGVGTSSWGVGLSSFLIFLSLIGIEEKLGKIYVELKKQKPGS